MSEPEGTRLAAQLGDAVGGPEVPADPETPETDLRRKLWNLTRLGESWSMETGTRREDGVSLLAVLGDAGAVLDRATIDAEPAGEPLTSAQCDRLRQMVTEHQEAAVAVRRALDLTAALDDADREIIAAGRAGLKVLEGSEEESRDNA